MADMIKVIEVLSQSPKSWEDATSRAVADLAGHMEVKSVYIHHMEALVENGKVTEYRINAKVSGIMQKA